MTDKKAKQLEKAHQKSVKMLCEMIEAHRADEREQCAKICDELQLEGDAEVEGYTDLAAQAAELIRARSPTKSEASE